MDNEVSRKLLRDYFSEITYIDDKFDTELIAEHTMPEMEGIIPLPFGLIANEPRKATEANRDATIGTSFKLNNEGESDAETQKNREESFQQLAKLLEGLNCEKYDSIKLRPIYYRSTISSDFLISKMADTPLSILDWELSTNIKALPIVKELLEKTHQLKVVIVYTNGYAEATATIPDVFGKDCLCIRTKHQNITCIQREHKSLVIIAAKQAHNLEDLLDIVCDMFIENYGVMATALLDFSNQVKKKSGDLFEAFSKPFEDLYSLQMHYSGIDGSELPTYLTSFIINKVQSDIVINPNIVSEMTCSAIQVLAEEGEKVQADVLADIQNALTAMALTLTGEYQVFCKCLNQVPLETYLQAFKNCRDITTWDEVVSNFSPVLLCSEEKYIEEKRSHYYSVFDDIELAEPKKQDVVDKTAIIIGEIKKAAKEIREGFTDRLFTVFLRIIISGTDMLYSTNSMVQNLKYHEYTDKCLCNVLSQGAGMNKNAKRGFLVNKLHFGDILVSEDASEYLICITPPCDVFRPEKTKLIVTFIRGKIADEGSLQVIRKESIHISAYPTIVDDKYQIKYIEWRLFDTKIFDLGDPEDYDAICKYSRPYTMDERYMRQIANQFTAYYSRAGVDELFMKAEPQLIKMFH